MPCGLQNGRRQPENVFFCAFYTCNGLICSLQSRLCIFFPFCSIQHPKKNKNKQTRNPETPPKKNTNPRNQKTKKQNKLHTQNGGRCRELGPVMFFVLFVFLVYCLFGSLFLLKGWQDQKKWQDLTFCYFSQLRVCKFVFCYWLLWVCGFMTKLRQNHRKM